MWGYGDGNGEAASSGLKHSCSNKSVLTSQNNGGGNDDDELMIKN